jgi:hypothetical protein
VRHPPLPCQAVCTDRPEPGTPAADGASSGPASSGVLGNAAEGNDAYTGCPVDASLKAQYSCWLWSQPNSLPCVSGMLLVAVGKELHAGVVSNFSGRKPWYRIGVLSSAL